MNTKSQAHELQTLLSQYSQLWDQEIMNEYPQSVKNYPPEWVDLLDSLDESELYAIDCKQIISPIEGSSFGQFMQKLIDLSALPAVSAIPEILLEDWAYNGVKKKKKHEIQSIVSVLKNLKDSADFDYVVDVGGGVGHLSRILSHYHAIASISLDQNAEFQAIGKARLKKYRKLPGSSEVEFVNMVFGAKGDPSELKKIFGQKSLTLGLHTCGALANTVIQSSIDYSTVGLLSFGCCYHRLNPESDFPLSSFYKENHFLKLNLYALSLATRSHAEMSFSDYRTKERVKYYRYGLHLFLIKYFNSSYFTEVGECNTRIYWGAFSEYVRLKMDELHLELAISDEEINQFYQDPSTQKELRVMFLCNIIRWQMGRALEVFLLLDRCLYLKEHGYKVRIEQYFKEALSPRNIGILALNKL